MAHPTTTAGVVFPLLTYEGPAPEPLPPCPLPTAADKRAAEAARQRERDEKREAEHDQVRQELKKKKGLWASLNALCEDMAHELDKTFDRAVGGVAKTVSTEAEDRATARFRKYFPHLMMERLVADFRCSLFTLSGPLQGSLLLSTYHLCFVAANTAAVAVRLPDIVSLQLALTLPPLDADAAPHVALVHDPTYTTTEASCLEVYTASQHLLVFGSFWDLRAAGASPLPCAAEVDRQWREAAAHCPVALAVPHDRFDHPQIGRYRPPVTPPTAEQPEDAAAPQSATESAHQTDSSPASASQDADPPPVGT
eukprot:EG_transcript_18983